MSNCIAQVCSGALLAFALLFSHGNHAAAEGVKPPVAASGVIAIKSA